MAYPSRVTWQFRNVSQDEDFWPTLESVEIQDTNQQDVATFSCEVVDAEHSRTIDPEDELWVKVDGVKVFAGRVKVLTPLYRSEVGPRAYRVEAQDFTARLDDSVIDHPKTRAAESASDRLDWILTFLNFSITTGGVNLPAENVDAGEFDGSTVREALDALADELRLSYYVDYEKDLHVFRTETVTAPFDLDNDDPDYVTRFPFSEWDGEPRDSVELANATLVIGEKRRAWVESAGSIATWGRQERALQDSELVTTAQIQNAGLRANAENDQPVIEGSFVCHEPGLQAGMTIRLTAAEWPAIADVVRIITEVSITAVDPHDALGVAYLRTEVTYSDRRRARPYRRARRRKAPADHQDGTAVTFTDMVLSAVRERIHASGGSVPAPLADSFGYAARPPGNTEVVHQSPAYRRSYLSGPCGFAVGIWTGWAVAEQWLELDIGSLAGVTAVRCAFTVSNLNNMDGKDLAYGYLPASEGPPTVERAYTELGRVACEDGYFDIPASVLTPSVTNYVVLAPGWPIISGVECCDTALLNGLEGPLGGVSPGGGEFNSGEVRIDWSSVITRVVADTGGLTPWTAMTGDIDGDNRVFTLPDWNGKGVPQVRIGGIVYGPHTDYEYDDEAGTVTMNFAPWVGAVLLARWQT